eukprot:s847_g3.t1
MLRNYVHPPEHCQSNNTKLKTPLGYCPQFDALLELLTVQDHLELYASIRGLPKQAVEEALQDFKLEKNVLSGGNRRKLSAALALMGSPSLAILDEPSCGLDPAARRALWTAVHDAVAGCSWTPVVGPRLGMRTEMQKRCRRMALAFANFNAQTRVAGNRIVDRPWQLPQGWNASLDALNTETRDASGKGAFDTSMVLLQPYGLDLKPSSCHYHSYLQMFKRTEELVDSLKNETADGRCLREAFAIAKESRDGEAIRQLSEGSSARFLVVHTKRAFAVDLATLGVPEEKVLAAADGAALRSGRELLVSEASDDEVTVAGLALAMADWHQRGTAKVYPRTDPVAIGLILSPDGRRILLGRGGSCELMLGCRAVAASEEVCVNKEEIDDARWFTRKEVQQMLQQKHPNGLWVPPRFAIANSLITEFATASRSLPPVGGAAFPALAGAAALGIKGIMGLGDKMSKSHLDRFKSFEKLPPKQAVLALCADMGAEDWNTQEETRKYAEKHLRILSGLYGIVRPYDDVKPVRDIPMNAKIKTKKGLYLTEFWGDSITKQLSKDLKSISEGNKGGHCLLVKCTSDEYFQSVQAHNLPEGTTLVEIQFEQAPEDVVAKARCLFARFVVEKKICTPEGLKDFKSQEWSLDERRCTIQKVFYVWIGDERHRKQKKSKKDDKAPWMVESFKLLDDCPGKPPTSLFENWWLPEERFVAMSFRTMNCRTDTTHGNPAIGRREHMRLHLMHRERLQNMRSALDTRAPTPQPHLQLYGRDYVAKKRATTEAAFSDLKMIQSIAKIMTRDSKIEDRKGPVSLNADRRKQELQEIYDIMKGNHQLLKRIETCEPMLRTSDMVKADKFRKRYVINSSHTARMCGEYDDEIRRIRDEEKTKLEESMPNLPLVDESPEYDAPPDQGGQ